MTAAQGTTRRSRVTTHVLDAVTGRPAVGVGVSLDRFGGPGEIATGVTDADGRVTDLGPADLAPGTYRITFATGDYFAERGQPTFYPQVVLTFTIDDPQAHYHVPLLLSPYAFSTYRGS